MPIPTMPFGKHKGEPFDKIPAGYFEWLLKQDWLQPGLRQEVEDYLQDDGAYQEELNFDPRTDPRSNAPPPQPQPAAPAAQPPRLGFTENELTDLRRVLHAGLRTILLQRDPDPGEPARKRFQALAEKLRKNGLMEEIT